MGDEAVTSSPADAARLVRGVSPVLATPFTDDGALAVDDFRRIVRHVLATGATSVMFPGFASEYYKLSDDERHTLRDVLLAETRADANVAAIVSVSDHATDLAVRSARAAVDAGADLVNLLPPHFLGPSAAAVHTHVRAVLEAVAPTPVILQYAPAQTGTPLDATSIARIAADHPNLRMVKVESAPPGRFIAALGDQQPALPAMVGHAGVQMLDALRRGAAGVQPGCSFAEIYLEIWRGWEAGDTEAAEGLHRRLLPYISYWMQQVELIIAAEKHICVRRGLIGSILCRAPARILDAEEIRMVDRFLDEFADLLPATRW